MKRLVLLGLVFAACGSPPPPPRRAAPAAAVPKPMEDDIKPISPSSIYVYSPVGKRDPFLNQTVTQATGTSHMEVKGRAKSALEKWSLDQLKLSLTVTGTATPLAMVEDPEQRGWTVHLGDFIGQNGGKVTGIHRDELIVTETITDHSTGRVYPQNVKLTVPVTTGEQKDLQALQEGERLGPAKGEQ